MVSLVPKKRFVFSPALMIIYVYFLKNNINNKNHKGKYFIRILLKLLYDNIDLTDLINNEKVKEESQKNHNDKKKEDTIKNEKGNKETENKKKYQDKNELEKNQKNQNEKKLPDNKKKDKVKTKSKSKSKKNK